MVEEKYTTEQLVTRWEDRREIKNLLGKYVVSHLLKKEPAMFESFWSKEQDICLGVNEGWFAGADAIRGYYDALDTHTRAVRDLLMQLFPEQVKGKTAEELYGIGDFPLRSTTNSVIEIAADGRTAKGMWHCFGKPVVVDERGPLSHWLFATYCVDFIKEDGQWRIWHMMYLEDINAVTGRNWSKNENPYPELPEFAALKAVTPPRPNAPAVLRQRYTVDRPFTRLPRVPEPYDTFAETFSYGM